MGAGRCTARQLQARYSVRRQIEVLFRALKSGARNLEQLLEPIGKNARRVRPVVLLSLCFGALTLKELYRPFSSAS